MKGRTREFNNTRDRHLSQTYSQLGESARIFPSYRETNDLGSSKSSVFLKNKTPLCVNCTNHKLVESRKERQFRDKAKQFEQQQKILEQAKRQNLQRKAAKVQQARQVDQYNKSVKQRQLNAVKSEKQFDGVWIQQTERRQKELQQLEAEVAQLKKQKQLRYREELHEQLEQQKIKKQEMKQEKLKTMPEQPIVKGEHINPHAKKYGQELKKQIAQDTERKKQQKALETEFNLLELKTAQQKFLEFTQFKNPKKNEANPEIFEEMKQMELQKKLEKIQNRCLLENQRKNALKKQKQKLEQSAKEELQRMRKYADNLSVQIAQKKRQEYYAKNQDMREISNSRYSQQIPQKVNTKPCGECHHEVREQEISYI